MIRKIIKIDEEKCTGCGQCVTGCAEGAIQLVDGKARLVSESYCDGLGACIGECPVGALTLEDKEAPEYDQAAVDLHLARLGRAAHSQTVPATPSGCPGSMARSMNFSPALHANSPTENASGLTNWPVQLSLLPINAPYLENASLLMAADCTAFAFPDFHRKFMKGKVTVIACPKLDDARFYEDKLTKIIQANSIEFIHVVYMEVPCCGGLVRLVKAAVEASSRKVPVKFTKIGIGGKIIDESIG